MTGIDDRAAFEEKKPVHALALGRGTFEAAVDALQAADKYDYSYLWSWMGSHHTAPCRHNRHPGNRLGNKARPYRGNRVARGGSVLSMASILELIGKGKVIGIDIDIRAHNRIRSSAMPWQNAWC